LLACTALILGLSAPARAAVVFSTDFESGVPAQLTGQGVQIESVQGLAGLGAPDNQFGGSLLRYYTQTLYDTSLTLTDLPPHTHVSLGFLVALIDSSRRMRAVKVDDELGNMLGTYARTKRESEAVARELQARHLPVVTTYPGSVWGPHDPHSGESVKLAGSMVRGALPVVMAGGWGVVDVRDVADLHARIMRPHAAPHRYPAFGHYVRMEAIHRLACAAAGVQRLRIQLPGWVLMSGLPLIWLLERLGVESPVTVDGLSIGFADQPVDNGDVEDALGLSFRPFERTATDMIAWMRAQGMLPAGPPRAALQH